jgi:hypothetical protein
MSSGRTQHRCWPYGCSDISPHVLSSECILEGSFFHSPLKQSLYHRPILIAAVYLWEDRFYLQWLLFLVIPQWAHCRTVLIQSRNQQKYGEGAGVGCKRNPEKDKRWKENVASAAVTPQAVLCRRYNSCNSDICIHVYIHTYIHTYQTYTHTYTVIVRKTKVEKTSWKTQYRREDNIKVRLRQDVMVVDSNGSSIGSYIHRDAPPPAIQSG